MEIPFGDPIGHHLVVCGIQQPFRGPHPGQARCRSSWQNSSAAHAATWSALGLVVPLAADQLAAVAAAPLAATASGRPLAAIAKSC
jgi:hypothetical protein